MLTRKLVVLIGILLAIVGALQMLIRERMEKLAWGAIMGNGIYVLGAVSIIVGLILMWAGARKLVRAYRVVLALGLITFLAGVFVVVAPVFARDIAGSFYFNRIEAYRVGATFFGGTLRVVIGIFLIWAGLQGPPQRTPRLGSIVPLA